LLVITNMIYELEKRTFTSIIPLITFGIRFPEVLSIVEGNNPGWIFTDKPDRPATALVWSKGIKGFYLVGDEKNTAFLSELNPYIDEHLAKRMHELRIDWFEICGNREAWDTVIESIFSVRRLSQSLQCIYTLDPQNYESRSHSAEVDCEVRKVNRKLLFGSELQNSEFVHSKIKQFWDSLEMFLERGQGYVVVCREEAASVCFSAFVAGNTHAIDVETTENYRRRGFAEIVAREFVKECIKRGLRPHWECMKENIASIALAEKLGFEKSVEYKLYSFPLEKRETH
jgi:RimJ/RimL family protein N-acetyltransferase